jgi:hypothetical protein
MGNADVFRSNTPFGQCTAGQAVVSVGGMAQVLNERALKITDWLVDVVDADRTQFVRN